MIFDTHCHLGFHDDAADQVHARAVEAGVTRMVDVGIDLESSRRARERSARLPGVSWTAGLHPNSSRRLDAEWSALAELARAEDCAAIGESGLDFYWDEATPSQQVLAFERHLALAVELDKPIVVHCRDAFPLTFEVLESFAGVRGVMHCFSGGVAEARRALELGLALSFAGPLTYPKATDLREAAAFAPADRVVVETDAPFLPPQDRRGKRNEPAFVAATLRRLADVRELEFEAAAALTTRNAELIFGRSA